jgi:hypothetical protein
MKIIIIKYIYKCLVLLLNVFFLVGNFTLNDAFAFIVFGDDLIDTDDNFSTAFFGEILFIGDISTDFLLSFGIDLLPKIS